MNSASDKFSASRRNFFKKTSLLATGGMLMGAIPSAGSLPVEKTAHAAGSDMLKLALIGCGGRGTGAVRMTLDLDMGVKLVAMVDVFRERLDSSYEALSSRFGGTEKLDVPEENKFVSLTDYKKAIELADIVILAAPPGFRPAHFREAVARGKHVFMEKPVAVDADGVREILKAGEEVKRKQLSVVVGLQRRYQKNYLKALEFVQRGRLGEIMSGQVYWNSRGVWVRPRMPEDTELQYQLRNWYYFNWLCGDHIVEQHIHNIDVANWFLGAYPISAQGMGGREVRVEKETGQIFDHHFVEFTYPGGVIISSQCRHQPNTMNRVAEHFQATGGHIETDGNNRLILRDRGLYDIYVHDGVDDPDPYVQEMDDWLTAIRTGTIIDDTEIGAKATLCSIMGRMATYSGQVITWDQAMNTTENLVPDPLDWNTPPPVLPDENGYYPVPVPGVTQFT